MTDLKTDYKDDVLNTEVNEQRKYKTIDNGDGTISLEDATEYLQQGDSFGAEDLNKMNQAINDIKNAEAAVTKDDIIDSLEEIEATTEAGLPAGALAVKEVNAKLGGCWIAFEDEEGNPTTEPYIHWLAEEEEASE